MSEVDPVIHQPTRLRIMSSLVGLDTGARVSFTFLQDLLGLTDGNLSVHLKKLEEAGFIATSKEFVARKPKTWLWLTESGRQAFQQYVEMLEDIIRGEEKSE